MSLIGGSARPRTAQAGDGPQALGLRASVQKADVGGVFQFYDDVLFGSGGRTRERLVTIAIATFLGGRREPIIRAPKPEDLLQQPRSSSFAQLSPSC